jgi:LmbE family N-acetylglucosaminyl deacetylase
MTDDARPATNEGIERILIVSAHPDDVDFGVAGSVATWTSSGIDVSYCIVTDGDAGGDDLEMPRDEMARIRRVEQTAAAATVGVHDLRFLAYPDGRLQPTIELRRDISRVIRSVRPQRVVCQSPERIWERVYASHPDHLAAGEATVCAVYPDARNPFAHPELLADGFDPWTVPELWLMAHPSVDVYVDTTDSIDKKIAALQCHKSQIPDPAGLDQRMREWGAMIGARVGLPEGRLAEAFKVVDAA